MGKKAKKRKKFHTFYCQFPQKHTFKKEAAFSRVKMPRARSSAFGDCLRCFVFFFVEKTKKVKQQRKSLTNIVGQGDPANRFIDLVEQFDYSPCGILHVAQKLGREVAASQTRRQNMNTTFLSEKKGKQLTALSGTDFRSLACSRSYKGAHSACETRSGRILLDPRSSVSS